MQKKASKAFLFLRQLRSNYLRENLSIEMRVHVIARQLV